MRFIPLISIAIATLAPTTVAAAQASPPTIPTVVAEAMNYEWSMFGKTQYFDGRPPSDWPASMIPSGARVIGGGVVGAMGVMRLQATVFAFNRGADPGRVLREMLVGNGYIAAEEVPAERPGGFMTTSMPEVRKKYCKSPFVASFAPVDSARDSLVFAVHLVDGDAAFSTCGGRRDRSMPTNRFPIDVPTLTPPPGGQSLGGGSNYGDSQGSMTSTVITSQPADSVLQHYSRQLLVAGWKAEGKAGVAEGVAVQRFSFTKGQEKWIAVLVVISNAANRYDLTIHFTRTA